MSCELPGPIAVSDLDGTITAAPEQFGAILRGLKAQGYSIVILTGTGNDQSVPVDQGGLDYKIARLRALGLSDCWDHIVLIGGDVKQLADAKAAWCAEHKVSVLVDNNKQNLKAATKAGVPLCLLPWATRE